MESSERPFEPTLPDDPESWSHEEWIAWLKDTDENLDPSGKDSINQDRQTIGSRITHSPSGTILGTAMTAMADVIYGPRNDDVVIVEEAPDAPANQDIEVRLNTKHPERSTVVIRHSHSADESKNSKTSNQSSRKNPRCDTI